MRVAECLKRTVSILLCLLMLLSATPELWGVGVSAVAETTGRTTEFAGGSGTESDPYLISTSEHLNNVRNYLSAHYKLVNDITFSATAFEDGGAFYNNGAGWIPIGTSSSSFKGVFDGNMYCIENVHIVGTEDYTAVFAVNSGTIKNLNITAIISSTYYYTGGIAGKNTGIIDNCSFSGTISGNFSVGGIAGTNEKSVLNSTNYGNIQGSDTSIGGISGYQSGSSASIRYCKNYGYVKSTSTTNNYGYAGGIIGAGEGKIEYCASHGTVTGDTAGGIAGKLARNVASASISYCYNTGAICEVTTSSTCGGIVGNQSYASVSYCYNSGKVGVSKANKSGGITGYMAAGVSTSISNCFNTGEISGYYTGGIFGRNTNFQNTITCCYNTGTITSTNGLKGGIGGRYVGGITKCYYLNNISAGAGWSSDDSYYSYDATACSSDAMRLQSTFSAFNFSSIWNISECVNNGYPYLKAVSIENDYGDNTLEQGVPEQDDPNVDVGDKEIQQQIGDVQLGPYALKGAVINILGYEISLIDLEANMTLDICDSLKIVADTDNTIKVLIGFDEGAKANIDGANNSTQYWSESYREVKSMYQDVTGQKVDTTRLWNKFSSMRGKLKKLKANMVVDVSAELAGYLEFQYEEGELTFSEGGVIAKFDANSSLRSYYGPCYVALGIEAGIDGSLIFTNEENKINPEITISPKFTIAAGGGIGTRSTYAQIDAYGTLSANIATDSDTPFKAGVELGVRWMGYIIGKEIFSDNKSFASMELYPNFGDPWAVSLMSLTPEVDVSNTAIYNDLINAAQPISRDYLTRPYSLRSAANYSGASFVKQNAYPLSVLNLVSFDDDTMLLVWVDDTAEKTDENMCSILYSYFDGIDWSEPMVIFEDGTANDMPVVYSDGRYAYVVWQKATQVFGDGAETSDMLQHFDLYAVVFDSQTQIMTAPVCVNAEDNAVFEFNAAVYGENGSFTVAWLENSDNNVYQMSGENALQVRSFDVEGNTLETKKVIVTTEMFTGLALGKTDIYYSVMESGSNNLYSYGSTAVLRKQGIYAFDYADGLLFCSDAEGFYAFDGQAILTYENIGALDDFKIRSNADGYVIFTPVLNEDFTKDLYYSRLCADTGGQWSQFEVYSSSGKYIRDYSPVLLSDSAVHVAFNYVEEDMQSAAVVVDRCTDEVDVSVEYVDFDDEQFSAETVDLRVGIKNKSSTAMELFEVSVIDDGGINLYTQEVSGTLSAFGNCEIVTSCTLPENYNREIYTVQVMPVGYADLNESNNIVGTTFECLHDYSGEWVTEIIPTQNTNGLSVLRCLKCEGVLAEKEVLQLRFSGASLSLQHNLAVNYKVDKALFEDVGYTDPYVVFELNGVKTTVSSYAISGDRYVFAFRNIAPSQMNDTIQATLYATYDGVEYASATREYSVAEYCYSMLDLYAADQYAELRTLLVDLLHYGAASQTYTGYRTDAMVNASLTDAQLLWGTSGDPSLDTVLDTAYKTVENPTAAWKGAGLSLQESVAMRLKFTAQSIDGLTVKIESGASTWTISSDKFLEEDGVYYVYFTGLDAGQMRQSVYLTICDEDTPVSNTVCYSIGSYAYEKQNSTIAGLSELVKTMMKYGDSAYAYAH